MKFRPTSPFGVRWILWHEIPPERVSLVDTLSKKIQKKRKELNGIRKAWDDLWATSLKNREILKTTVTVEEACEMCRRGEVTMEEFQDYAEKRKNLEYMVAMDEELFSGGDPLIEKLENELQDLEKERKHFWKTIVVLFLPVIAFALDGLFRWMENHGSRFHPIVYEALFCIAVFGFLVDGFLLFDRIGSKK